MVDPRSPKPQYVGSNPASRANGYTPSQKHQFNIGG